MKLWAFSDLHLRYSVNRQALEALPAHPEDWLILGGDLGETEEHLRFAFQTLGPRFRQLLWVPGNHELWTPTQEPSGLRGVAKYERLVALCREHGVLSPEDPYPRWPGEGPPTVLAPLFVLYDYSFRPDEIPEDQAVAWAVESGVLCTDEAMLHPDPYPTRQAWCAARVTQSERRLAAIPADHQTVLINHFPLRRELVRLWRIPRFSVWCGTRKTEEWHTRFRARAVVSGHLHMRATDYVDGVRFEEVSLGYPRQWDTHRGALPYLREILPGAEPAPEP